MLTDVFSLCIVRGVFYLQVPENDEVFEVPLPRAYSSARNSSFDESVTVKIQFRQELER